MAVDCEAETNELLGLDVIARDNRGYQSQVHLEDSIAGDGFSRTLGKIETEAGLRFRSGYSFPMEKTMNHVLWLFGAGHGGKLEQLCRHLPKRGGT